MMLKLGHAGKGIINALNTLKYDDGEGRKRTAGKIKQILRELRKKGISFIK
jgi:hypothetical protein